MNLSKIHHIAIIVSNYKSAKDFYVNKLGFSIIRENYRPERKDWKLELRVEPSGGLWSASSCFLCGECGADGERTGGGRDRM